MSGTGSWTNVHLIKPILLLQIVGLLSGCGSAPDCGLQQVGHARLPGHPLLLYGKFLPCESRSLLCEKYASNDTGPLPSIRNKIVSSSASTASPSSDCGANPPF